MLLEGDIDLDDLGTYEAFFRRLYLLCDLDPKGIQPLRQGLSFASVARKLRLIEDASVPVVVPYGEAEERLASLRRLGPDRLRLRALQPFVVNIFPKDVSNLKEADALEEVADGVLVLSAAFHGLYDLDFGLVADDDPQPDPARLVV